MLPLAPLQSRRHGFSCRAYNRFMSAPITACGGTFFSWLHYVQCCWAGALFHAHANVHMVRHASSPDLQCLLELTQLVWAWLQCLTHTGGCGLVLLCLRHGSLLDHQCLARVDVHCGAVSNGGAQMMLGWFQPSACGGGTNPRHITSVCLS
jgi:hypothetical protein